MDPNRSRRAFLKHASSLALISGLAPAMSFKGYAGPPDVELDELAKAFEADSLGQVLRRGHDEFSEIGYYNARFDCVTPGAYFRPATTEGVVKIIEWSKRHHRTLAIRGGGHSFEGKSSHREVVIDMSQLTNHKLMRDGTLHVGAGVLLGDIYNTLGAADRILPAGTCPTVGIVGHALGGGVGDFLPMYGYAAQSLKSATLVTMSGSVLEVSDEAITVTGGAPMPVSKIKTPDLMRVLRGGGQGSLGVVTNMTFQTYDVSSTELAVFHLESDDGVSAQKAVEILLEWQDWREELPQEMRSMVSSKVNLSRSGDRYEFEIAGVIAIHEGSDIGVSDVRRTLKGLFQNSGLPKRRFSQSLSIEDVIETFIDTDETTNNTARDMLYGSSSVLPSALRQRAVEYLIENLQEKIFASLYTSGGKSKTGVATSLHSSEFLIEWTTYVPKPDRDGHRDIAELRSQVMKIAGFRDFASPNYPDDSARDYFSNRAQIEQLIKAFDPGALSTSSLLAGNTVTPADGKCH